MADPCRRVGARLVLRVHEPLRLVLQVAVSGMAPAGIEEHLDVTCDGKPLELTEVEVPGAGRVHIGDPPPGELTVDYTATIRGTAQRPTVTDADRVTYLRPSRYAESDRLAAVLRTGQQRPDRGRRRHTAQATGRVPRLRASGHRVAARAGRARADGGGVRARSRPDGLPRRCRGGDRRRVARGRCDAARPAVQPGSHRDRARRRRHPVPVGVRRCGGPARNRGHGGHRRTTARRQCPRTSQPQLSVTSLSSGRSPWPSAWTPRRPSVSWLAWVCEPRGRLCSWAFRTPE